MLDKMSRTSLFFVGIPLLHNYRDVFLATMYIGNHPVSGIEMPHYLLPVGQPRLSL